MRRASSTNASPSLEALSCPPPPRPPSASSSSSSHHDPQQQQRAHVRRVLQARHAFEVLALPLQATSAVIVRGAFRKFALLLHPDKNAAPDAQKAFIRLSEAYEILRDAGEQRDLLAKLQPQRSKGCGGSKGDRLDDTSFSFVRPTGTNTSSSSTSANSSSSTSKNKTSSLSSSRSFMDVLREWEDFEREYMEEVRSKQTSVESQARKEKRRSRREDVEERQAAERRVLLAHLMESVWDDDDEGEEWEVGKGGKEGGQEEGEVEEEPTPKRKGNSWQDFVKGKKCKQGGVVVVGMRRRREKHRLL